MRNEIIVPCTPEEPPSARRKQKMRAEPQLDLKGVHGTIVAGWLWLLAGWLAGWLLAGWLAGWLLALAP